MAVVELQEVGGFEGGLELFDENGGVVGRDAEGDGGADVAEDGVADGVGHLGGVLVCDGEIETVFSGLGENDGEGIGGEVLELIDVEIEGATVFYVFDVGAGHGGELDGGNEEGAENAGVVFADETFTQVYDENLSLVHNFADVEGGFRLADNITNNGVGGEGADLVQNRGDGLVDLFFVPLAEFVFPELEDSDIGTIIESFFSEIFVGEHAGDVEKGGRGAIKKSEEGEAENVLETRAPRVAEHTFQDADNFGADVGFSRVVGKLEWVISHGKIAVGGVEINDVVNAIFGDETEVVNGEVAVRVDDTIALIMKNVGEGKKFEHAAFSGAGLADDVNVATAIGAKEAELVVDAAEIGEAEGGDIFVDSVVPCYDGELRGRLGGFAGGPDYIRGFDGGVGEVVNGGELGNV